MYGSVQECGKDALELAVNDMPILINAMYNLENWPKFNVKVTKDKNHFNLTNNAININFSLFNRYSNKNFDDVIFIRTNYFDFNEDGNLLGLDKNHFNELFLIKGYFL